MLRSAAFVLFLTLGFGIHKSHGTEVSVKDTDGKLCLYANLMVNFSVSYATTENKSEIAELALPDDVTTDGSLCEDKSSTLKLSFGEGHSWAVNFTVNEKAYQADTITVSFNLSDTTVFPKSASNVTMSVVVKPHITNVGMDTCYSCNSHDTIQDEKLNQTLWNVLIQAFVVNGSKSENMTSCSADLPTTTTVAPTTTTVAPTTPATTTTTAAPVTNITSAAPTTTPTPAPTLPTPTTGKYSIKPDENSTACLMADFGLRIGFTLKGKHQEANFEPNGTTVSGSCGANSSELVLTSNTMIIALTFANDTKKFRLHALNITGTGSLDGLQESNSNLSLWEAAVGSSYMCNKEQNYTINNQLTLYTFELHVQPFAVKKGAFSTAHECSLDDTGLLIPIIVGTALAALILIVVIAYVIGRRKTYVGYQTL